MDQVQTGIGEFGATFRRQLPAMTLVAGPLFALIAGIAVGLPDMYRSTGVIRIEQDVTTNNRAVDTYAEYYIQTLTADVFTNENLDAWISEFGVYDDEAGWSENRQRSEMRSDLGTEIVATQVIDPRLGREREVVTGFKVFFDSSNPETAYNVTSAAVDAFLVENRRARQARGEEEIEFFREESERYRAQIAEVEARLAEFKERNARTLPDLMQVNMSAMERVERDLETAQLQIDNLKRERVILQSQLGQIPSTSDEAIKQLAELQNEYVRVSSIYQDTHPTVVSIRKQIDQLSQNVDSAAAIPILRQQQEEIGRALAEAREKYSEDHPDVKQLVRSESAIKDRIAALADRSSVKAADVASTNDLYIQLDTQLKAVDSEISGLNSRIAELRSKRQDYEELLLQTPQTEREYQELQRDLVNARDLYEETQEKQRDAELALARTRVAQGEQLVLAQAANRPSNPSWPPRAAIIVLGAILAVGAAVGVATLRETSGGTVRSSRDVFELCGMPPIALVPTIHNRKSRFRQKAYAVSYVVALGVLGSLAYFGAAGL